SEYVDASDYQLHQLYLLDIYNHPDKSSILANIVKSFIGGSKDDDKYR
ncbi:28716_t:CDS:1, partial [Dentiscutata erythropus]